MKELIKIEKNAIDGTEVNTVDARTLREKLGAGKKFTTWIQDRIGKYGFVKDVDYLIEEGLSFPKSGSSKARPRKTKEYLLTLDMAKELCMVENNDIGREFRRYFIECERKLREGGSKVNVEQLLVGLVQSQSALMDTEFSKVDWEESRMSTDIIEYDFHGSVVRTLQLDGRIWFVAKDVAKTLGHENPKRAVRTHCKRAQPVGVTDMVTLNQQTVIIPESDVYRLITKSSKDFLKLLPEKRHDSIKRTMESLAERGLIAYSQTVDVQLKGNNRRYEETVYHVNETDSYVVMAQLSPEFMAAVVKEWKAYKDTDYLIVLPQSGYNTDKKSGRPAKEYILTLDMAKELCMVENNEIGNTEVNTVDARNLHEKLGVERKFAGWITARIKKYGFVKDIDYITCYPNRGTKMHGGVNRREYLLTLDQRTHQDLRFC